MRYALICLAILLTVPVRAQRSPPNIVFFLIDDLGWADLGVYGSKYHETPNLDRLAAQGMRFTDAYAACPVCSPTRESILTGKCPARTRLTNFLVGQRWPKDSPLEPLTDWSKGIKPADATLPELLKSAGYATGHIGKWHLGADQRPQDHGFDVNVAGGRWGTPPAWFPPYKNQFIADGAKEEYLTDRLGVEADKFIDQHKDKPFYLQVWHYGVHIPLRAPDDLVKKYQAKNKPAAVSNAVYAAMLESVDATVGRVMKKLDEHGLADRTILIFTSDNGGLHVPEGGATPTSNAPLREGKGFVYEGGIRVPLIVRWPGVVKAGAVTSQVTTSIDWLPTLAEATGVNAPAGIDGVSILSALKGAGDVRREAVYWHYPHYANQGGRPAGAVRAADWKLIEHYEDGKVELFNLRDDVGEVRDLSATTPEQVRKLRGMLQDWRRSVDAQMPKRKG